MQFLEVYHHLELMIALIALHLLIQLEFYHTKLYLYLRNWLQQVGISLHVLGLCHCNLVE